MNHLFDPFPVYDDVVDKGQLDSRAPSLLPGQYGESRYYDRCIKLHFFCGRSIMLDHKVSATLGCQLKVYDATEGRVVLNEFPERIGLGQC